MIRTVPNSGIFNDESLDRLRGEAIAASQNGLPEEVVYYLRALEARLLEVMFERKRADLTTIGWKHLQAEGDE